MTNSADRPRFMVSATPIIWWAPVLESLSDGSGILKLVVANQCKVVTDDEVKRMFETLIGE